MILQIVFAILAGLLVGLSRQLNGRLSLSTSPFIASFWNHLVGFGALTILGLAIGGLIPQGAADAPWHAYIGGPIGVVFVGAGSWLIARIGAVNTAILIIGGQMASGVLLDFAGDHGPLPWAGSIGVAMILTGIVIGQKRRKVDAVAEAS